MAADQEIGRHCHDATRQAAVPAFVADNTDTPVTSPKPHNLTRRIISGLVMATIAIGLVYAGPKPFALLVIAIAIMMAWEWGRLARGAGVDPPFLIHASSVASAAVLTVLEEPLFALVALALGVVLTILVCSPSRRPLASALGVFYVGLPTVAILWFRSDLSLGFTAVVFLVAIASASDIAAFVGGKLLGGPKLWPSISPNKTWAGFIAASCAAATIGAVSGLILAPDLIPVLTAKSLVLGAVSQAGDLAESALKRSYNVKDTSDLIPGHGGFMDRLDSAVAVALAAGMLALIIDARAPATAILYGI